MPTKNVKGVVFKYGDNGTHCYWETVCDRVTYCVFRNRGERMWWVNATFPGGGMRILNIEPYNKADSWLEPDGSDRDFDCDYWTERLVDWLNKGNR